MIKKQIQIFTPKYLINNLEKKNDLIFSILNLILIISSFDQKIKIYLMSGEDPKFTIILEKTINFDLFKKIISNGFLDMFSRGDVKVNTGSKCYYFEIENFLSNENSNALAYIETKSKERKNSIEINKIIPKDIIFWQKINQYSLCLNTLVGFSKSKSNIELIHTGQPRTITSDDRQTVWGLFANNKDSIYHFPEFEIVDKTGKLKILFSISFDPQTEDFIIINDTKSIYLKTYSEILKKECVYKNVKQKLTPRLVNHFSFYLELKTDDLKLSNYFGYIGESDLLILRDLVNNFLDKCINSKSYLSFLLKAQKIFIDREDRDLKKRKLKASIRKDVFFYESNKKKNFLIKVPENEQEVVLLTTILSARNLFFINFEYLDYFTAKGIDSIVNFKIFEGDKSFESGVVEFKLKLESFTDERHPISLIDLIIAWELNSKNLWKNPS